MTHVHHSALCPGDMAASLRFYRDGLGFQVLMDHEFDGAWSTLFEARSDHLHSVFLGDTARADAGIVELVTFDGGVDAGPESGPPATGFFLLSLFVDVDATLSRLRALGLGGEPRRIEVPGLNGSVAMATVRDPDGLVIELIDASAAGA
jgi:catechol 2,3-dioxygenase-like lactoylglutathione lyase family enzyme